MFTLSSCSITQLKPHHYTFLRLCLLVCLLFLPFLLFSTCSHSFFFFVRWLTFLWSTYDYLSSLSTFLPDYLPVLLPFLPFRLSTCPHYHHAVLPPKYSTLHFLHDDLYLYSPASLPLTPLPVYIQASYSFTRPITYHLPTLTWLPYINVSLPLPVFSATCLPESQPTYRPICSPLTFHIPLFTNPF